MLVLTRKTSETVRLFVAGHEIVVMVCAVNSFGHVRLGFDAEMDVRIVREEILEEPARAVEQAHGAAETAADLPGPR